MMGYTSDHVDLERIVRLLQDAAGRMAEAYALLRQVGPTAEPQRWDDNFSWQLEALQKAIDTCTEIERRVKRAGRP